MDPNITILASLIRELAHKDENEKEYLERKILEAKMRAEYPSLFEFKQLVTDDDSPNAPAPGIIRTRLKELLFQRESVLNKSLITGNEWDKINSSNVNQEGIVIDRLNFFKSKLTEADNLDKRINEQREMLDRKMNDFLNAYEFMVVNFGLDYKLEHDKKSIEHLMFCAQHLLMERRYKNTESAFTKYGSKEQIVKLKKNRQELEQTSKTLKARLEQLKQQEAKIQKLDSTLRKEYLKLVSELECKKWALKNLKNE